MLLLHEPRVQAHSHVLPATDPTWPQEVLVVDLSSLSQQIHKTRIHLSRTVSHALSMRNKYCNVLLCLFVVVAKRSGSVMHIDEVSISKVVYLLSLGGVVLNNNQKRRTSVDLEVSLLA